LKRNRLVVLIGFFLAAVAFALVVLTLNGNAGKTAPTPSAAPTASVVVAAGNIPLGAKIIDSDLTTKTVPLSEKPVGAFSDVSQVIGQIARMAVTTGQLITPDVLGGATGGLSTIEVPAGKVAIAVQVDQITGVGTIIKAGDHVDVVAGRTKVPVVEWQTAVPPAGYVNPPAAIDQTAVKTLVQGLQVLGTLLPPQTQAGATAATGVTLDLGRYEIVILAATAEQAEIIKFAQSLGSYSIITLVLRSAADCQDANGAPAPCASATTAGITLRVLVDNFGVVPPQMVEVIEPTHLPNPNPARGGPNR
jgi:Flp pilus assembly protein CpaB